MGGSKSKSKRPKESKPKQSKPNVPVTSNTETNSKAMAGHVTGSETIYIQQKTFNQKFVGQSLENSLAHSIPALSGAFFPSPFFLQGIESHEGVQGARLSPRPNSSRIFNAPNKTTSVTFPYVETPEDQKQLVKYPNNS